MNDKFKAYAEKIAKAALAAKPADLEALKAADVDGETVEDVVTDCHPHDGREHRSWPASLWWTRRRRVRPTSTAAARSACS